MGENQANNSIIYKDIFLSYGSKRCLEKNSYLLERGSPSNELWYITQGTVRAFCTGYDGEDITLFYISENNIIYLESLIPNSVIIQDAQAITPLTFYALSAEKFFQIVRPELPAFEAMFSHFLNRIILLHEYILCSHFRESSKRVAYLLYATYKHSGPVIPYTHEQIAAITGINRISANRILNGFAKEKIISLGYRHIKVLSPSRLSEVFNSIGSFSNSQE